MGDSALYQALDNEALRIKKEKLRQLFGEEFHTLADLLAYFPSRANEVIAGIMKARKIVPFYHLSMGENCPIPGFEGKTFRVENFPTAELNVISVMEKLKKRKYEEIDGYELEFFGNMFLSNNTSSESIFALDVLLEVMQMTTDEFENEKQFLTELFTALTVRQEALAKRRADLYTKEDH